MSHIIGVLLDHCWVVRTVFVAAAAALVVVVVHFDPSLKNRMKQKVLNNPLHQHLHLEKKHQPVVALVSAVVAVAWSISSFLFLQNQDLYFVAYEDVNSHRTIEVATELPLQLLCGTLWQILSLLLQLLGVLQQVQEVRVLLIH